jgi:hypothetical protein
MSLRGKVQTAPPNSRGIDTDTQLSSSTSAAFVSAGYTFAIRYLSLGTPESASDLTAQEADDILASGLALMSVQHAPNAGWWPTFELGEQYGQAAAQNATAIGLPPGLNVWLDLEGVNAGASSSDVVDYCNAWSGEVSGAGYLPGLYLGYDTNLDSGQLDEVEIQYFWKSGSDTSTGYPYPVNGFCLLQNISSSYVLDGVSYDLDVTQADNLGNTPLWLKSDPSHHHDFLHTRSEQSSEKSLEQSTPAHTNTLFTSSPPADTRSRSPLFIALLVLAGLLLYAAGVITGPMILPDGQTALAAIMGKGRGDTPVPVKTAAPQQPAQSTQHQKAPATEPVAAAPVAATEPVAKAAKPRSLLVASFSGRENAERLARQLENADFGHATVSQSTVDGRQWTVVRLGPYSGSEEAAKVADQLKEKYNLHPSILPAGE